jgi:hypothetical protein
MLGFTPVACLEDRSSADADPIKAIRMVATAMTAQYLLNFIAPLQLRRVETLEFEARRSFPSGEPINPVQERTTVTRSRQG